LERFTKLSLRIRGVLKPTDTMEALYTPCPPDFQVTEDISKNAWETVLQLNYLKNMDLMVCGSSSSDTVHVKLSQNCGKLKGIIFLITLVSMNECLVQGNKLVNAVISKRQIPPPLGYIVIPRNTWFA